MPILLLTFLPMCRLEASTQDVVKASSYTSVQDRPLISEHFGLEAEVLMTFAVHSFPCTFLRLSFFIKCCWVWYKPFLQWPSSMVCFMRGFKWTGCSRGIPITPGKVWLGRKSKANTPRKQQHSQLGKCSYQLCCIKLGLGSNWSMLKLATNDLLKLWKGKFY